MVSEIGRYGMVPIFGALHRGGNHLVRWEVSTSASRASCVGPTGTTCLLLEWSLAVLIEQDIARQWNGILRLILLLLLLLLRLLLKLGVRLLLLQCSGHLRYTLVRSARGLTGNRETTTRTYIRSITGCIG